MVGSAAFSILDASVLRLSAQILFTITGDQPKLLTPYINPPRCVHQVLCDPPTTG